MVPNPLMKLHLHNLKKVWDGLDEYKTLIGLSLYFIRDHILPTNTWYGDLIEILAYSFVFVGGAHKLIKSRYGHEIQHKISNLRKSDNNV